ncbi:odorant receptor 22b-like [Trichoplusia ni]|uniref:Odorant receptor n=1 Tax=Trichoplusia ni TaxID=7111 RepID=A0A7E5WAQ9_TRINI|nr:odorant receptor 22b-like [Trichoplusia ni]
MALVKNLWRKLTHTKALDQSCGKFETVFFESVYRVAYLTGLSTSDHDVPYLLYSNAVKLSIVLLICGEVWFGFTETSSLDEVAASINATVIQFIAVYRYRNMMEHKAFYKEMATSMNSPYFDISTEKRRKLIDYWSQMNETYLKLLLGLGNCTLAAWFIFPLVDEVEYNLIVGIRLPFYYKTPELYPLAYIIVVIAFMYISHFVMVTDLIMQTHLMHLLCQFSVLSDCFENLVTDCRPGFEDVPQNNLVDDPKFAAVYLKRLGELVQQHKRILSYTMKMRSTLSGPMLGQLAASFTLICFVGYQATTTIAESIAKCLMSFLFLGYNVFELYIICRWCEEITNESQKVGEAIYCSGWECGLAKLPGVKSTIVYVMARANKPLYFTAGGMYNLTLTSYTTLVKTSYSALTVLLRFRHD